MPAPQDSAVFHLCTRDAIESARARGVYRAASLDTEGFIHLSRAHQVLPTVAAYFAGVPDLVVLTIDAAALTAPLVYEAPAPLPSDAPKPAEDDLYPHCYGPIELSAIVDVMDAVQFSGLAVHPDTMAVLRRMSFQRLPVEGTLFRSTWRSAGELASGAPIGTAMIGLYAESPASVSMFHRLSHDEVWHAYGGDPFSLYLLHADGRTEQLHLGTDVAAGQQVQVVVPAGTWQAGAIDAGGRYALFGCTMAPGFTDTAFEAGRADLLLAQYPAAAPWIERLAITAGSTRMPEGFAT